MTWYKLCPVATPAANLLLHLFVGAVVADVLVITITITTITITIAIAPPALAPIGLLGGMTTLLLAHGTDLGALALVDDLVLAVLGLRCIVLDTQLVFELLLLLQ